jgi:hypothetical protein
MCHRQRSANELVTAQIRNRKAERNPKSEIRETMQSSIRLILLCDNFLGPCLVLKERGNRCQCGVLGTIGLRISFGLRPSDLGFGVSSRCNEQR